MLTAEYPEDTDDGAEGLAPMRFTPHDYQTDCCLDTLRALENGLPSGLIVIPTGGGKTVVMMMIARCVIEDGGRVLILAHTGELIEQAVNKADFAGLPAAVERADQHARPDFTRGLAGANIFGESPLDPKLVVATVQTMQGKRLRAWPPGHFDLVVTDECFPAGTLVDGRPIESIGVGDPVISFNETTWKPEMRPVTRLFRRKPSSLVRVHLDDGTDFVCTPEHPIFTYAEDIKPTYLAAKDLCRYDLVYGITPPWRSDSDADRAQDMRGLRDGVRPAKLESDDDTGLLGALQGGTASREGQGDGTALHELRGEGRVPGASRPQSREEGPGILLGGMQGGGGSQGQFRDDGPDQSPRCIGTNGRAKPDASGGVASQDGGDTQGFRPSPKGSWGQREGADACTVDSRGTAWLADGSRGQDRSLPGRLGLPDELQDRRGESGRDGGNRDRWSLARHDRTAGAGSEEGNLSPVARVDRVEVLEPGSDGRFGGLCPDGFVYNVEVERNHNYFVGGVLVHNCHHAEAQTYRNVIDHLRPRWHLGFTATADRGDGKPICGANQVFERCTFEYHLHDAVRNGFLKRPVAKVLDTTIDLSSLRVVGAKDLNEKEIEELLLPHVAEICNELRDKLTDHRAVIFTPMVASADAIATALCSLGIAAVSVSGEDDDRASIFRDFREGRYQHIVNAMLCTEGWDEPFVDSAVILRPTKSRALYSQMAGRALRRYEGKPEGYIWGLNWKTHGHDLVHPVQIFDSPSVRINPGIVHDAKALVDSGEEVDLALALKRAQAERKERKRIALAVKAERATAVEYSYDPLSIRAEDVRAGGFATAPPQKLDALATERQVEALVKMGIRRESAVSWSKARASGFIGAQAERREKGLCSYKQQLLLKSLGHPDPRPLAFEAASAAIDRLRRGLPAEATT